MTDANYTGETPCPTCGNAGNHESELEWEIEEKSKALHMATTELEQCRTENGRLLGVLGSTEAVLKQTETELAEYKRRAKAAEKHLSEFASVHYAIEFGVDLLTGAATGPAVTGVARLALSPSEVVTLANELADIKRCVNGGCELLEQIVQFANRARCDDRISPSACEAIVADIRHAIDILTGAAMGPAT